MKIDVEQLSSENLKPLFTDASQLGFGQVFTDRMFVMNHSKTQGWHNARITEYKPFSIDPAASVLHYGQEIFEGLKAYAAEDGRVLLFRPEQNARRMARSAERMCMPPVPEEDFLQALDELVMLEKRWIPRAEGTSLYIRPAMVGIDNALGVHPAAEYLFYIILSPSGAYFKGGFQPVGLYVEDRFVRAVVGGVGDAKTGGNYAASLLAGAEAQKKGFSQVLWLDGRERRFVEEGGAMNIFFVSGDKLVTPALTGSILPGITRASVLELAQSLGLATEERTIAIDEVVSGIADGTVTEIFCAGTAAVISPVGNLHYQGRDFVIDMDQPGEVTRRLYEKLTGIQNGRVADPFGWVREIGRL